MRWDNSKKLISRKVISKKAKQFLSKMIPVEGNVFQPIAFNSANDNSNTGNNPTNDPTEMKNIYLKPFTRIASVLKLTKRDKSKRGSTAWTNGGGNQRGNGGNHGPDPSATLPDNNHGHHLPTSSSHTPAANTTNIQAKVTFSFLNSLNIHIFNVKCPSTFLKYFCLRLYWSKDLLYK